MGEIRESVDISTFTFDKKTYIIKNDKHWAKLRFKRDKKNEPYLDILAGKRSNSKNNLEKNYFHAGYTIETEKIFVEDRNKIHNVKRTLDSKSKGRILEESDVLKKERGDYTFTVKIDIDEDSRRITLQKFEFLETP